ncbi:hypothetical protein KFE80_05290 [bacterium SCSIO 12696]|nr:hypothetical protein KFE80_05290 [bacterium SCSIO 12696]
MRLSLWLYLVLWTGWVSAVDDSTLSVAGSTITIAMPDSATQAQRQKIERWIHHAAESAVALYGRLPVEAFSVHISFAHRSWEPVPWGQVTRSRIPRVTFHIDPRFPLSRFKADWTAVHEFSHLFLPYPGGRGIWFSEGLASYYQNVLMARAGTHSPERAWKKLYAGFRRGRADSSMAHLSLRRVSPLMWRTGSYMRVYWSGAAYFLSVDVALRTRPDNPSSLDQALERFRSCCMEKRRHWSTRALIRELDRQVGGDVFWSHYQVAISSKTVPDIAVASAQLGIEEKGTRLRFNESGARLRRGIMTPQ